MPGLSRRRSSPEGLNPWPGYVDALSTLLMVIIFVLLVFVLAQAFLSVTLSRSDRALTRLHRQITELSDMLSLERGRTADLRGSIAQLTRDLQSASDARDKLTRQLAGLRTAADQAASDRDALKSERDKLAAQLADAQLQAQSSAARTKQLQAQITEAASSSDTAKQQSATRDVQLADTERRLATAQSELASTRKQLDAMRRQIAELDKTVTVGKQTIEAKLSELAKLNQQVTALAALRDSLDKQAKDAAVRATTEQQRREAAEAALADQKDLSDSAKAHVALLTQQVEQLRAQLQSVANALQLSTKAGQDKDAQIVELGKKLNTALARKVQELEKYRSEFFGKLRAVLQNRKGINIVGDRFVFQSEVLFPVGSAELTGEGSQQIDTLADTLKGIVAEIPAGMPWILRVDGHADKQPITGGPFASNWELSTQRAVNVVKQLIQDGIPANHLAAAGFGDEQPLVSGDTPEDYAKNRRIEFRLTDR